MYQYFDDAIRKNAESPAIADVNTVTTYSALHEEIRNSIELLQSYKIGQGDVVSLQADFSVRGIALLFALIQCRCIVVPLLYKNESRNNIKIQIALARYDIKVHDDGQISCVNHGGESSHDYYDLLRERRVPGLVLFTSGTSGEPKAAVHDFNKLLKKFCVERKAQRTLNFLLFDHWGGLNTLFHILSNGGVVVTLIERNPVEVCEAIEKYKVEVLPASPTFLNLLVLSEAYKQYDLSSLKMITYGAEPMSETTLKMTRNVFPNVDLKQTYGLIELGVLRSVSRGNDSTWLKIGGEGYDIRIVNSILEIRSESAMLGYLNAESPFTADGFFMTGDAVVQDGEFVKILGRATELINVGGEKVYPVEVESVIRSISNIEDVVVYSEKSSLTGEYVCAKVKLISNENKSDCIRRIKKSCREIMEPFKVPVKISIEDDVLFTDRFKIKRAN